MSGAVLDPGGSAIGASDVVPALRGLNVLVRTCLTFLSHEHFVPHHVTWPSLTPFSRAKAIRLSPSQRQKAEV